MSFSPLIPFSFAANATKPYKKHTHKKHAPKEKTIHSVAFFLPRVSSPVLPINKSKNKKKIIFAVSPTEKIYHSVSTSNFLFLSLFQVSFLDSQICLSITHKKQVYLSSPLCVFFANTIFSTQSKQNKNKGNKRQNTNGKKKPCHIIRI